MLTAEFDLEEAKKIWQEEAFEDGFEAGEARGEARGETRGEARLARKLLALGVPMEKIAEAAELPFEEILTMQQTPLK